MRAHKGCSASGLEGVVVAETDLSEVDGEAGRLVIGGYEVEALTGAVTFEDVCSLLWAGALPDEGERERMRQGPRRRARACGRLDSPPRQRPRVARRHGRPARRHGAPRSSDGLGERVHRRGRGRLRRSLGAHADGPAACRARSVALSRGGLPAHDPRRPRVPSPGGRHGRVPRDGERSRPQRLHLRRARRHLHRIRSRVRRRRGDRRAQGSAPRRRPRPRARHARRDRRARPRTDMDRERAGQRQAHHGYGPPHLPRARSAGRRARARRRRPGGRRPHHLAPRASRAPSSASPRAPSPRSTPTAPCARTSSSTRPCCSTPSASRAPSSPPPSPSPARPAGARTSPSSAPSASSSAPPPGTSAPARPPCRARAPPPLTSFCSPNKDTCCAAAGRPSIASSLAFVSRPPCAENPCSFPSLPTTR